ncbi:MAG: nicotinate-nucleotide--dimethylbenzimidazole phosphoribosyltransferase [Hyphomicrobiaceae bacterium]
MKSHDRLPDWAYRACPMPSDKDRQAAMIRQSQLTKPAGALGRLETLAVELASLQATERPRAACVPIVIFAGDHGIVAQGISAYPQEVTIAMMANFAAGGAAISVMARQLGSRLEVVDVGSLAQHSVSGVVTDKPRCGSRDFSQTTALDLDHVSFAFEAGQRAFARLQPDKPDLVILGEMGIGNTTSSAAVAAVLLGVPASAVTGAGTGLDPDSRARKASIIEAAIGKHGLRDPKVSVEQVFTAVGGLEIAALCGATIAAAQAGVPILIDGFIASVAALAATRLSKSCRPYLIFAHRSAEDGHRRVLEALNAQPLLDLALRLGEGSGAAIALPLLRAACALHNDMATFSEAAVPDRAH